MVQTKGIKVREAGTSDLKVLMQMGEAMHKESTFRTLPYDYEQLGRTLLYVLGHETGVMLVAESGGDVIGALGVVAHPAYSSKALIASDVAFYIKPEFRGSMAAVRLLQSAIQWAASMDVRRLTMANSAGADSATFDRLMIKQGFKVAGSVCYMDFGG